MRNGQQKQQRLSVRALEERVEKLKAELAGVADEIAELERSREADLAGCQAQLAEAQGRADAAKARQEEAQAEAVETERKGRALISSGEKLLHEAEEQRAAAEKMDLQLEPVRAAERRIRERQEHWKTELARVQSGPTRRKRAQLEQTIAKLERRMARKVKEPDLAEGPVSVVPKGDYGTPQPEPEPDPVKEMLAHPLETVAALAAGAAQREPEE